MCFIQIEILMFQVKPNVLFPVYIHQNPFTSTKKFWFPSCSTLLNLNFNITLIHQTWVMSSFYLISKLFLFFAHL